MSLQRISGRVVAFLFAVAFSFSWLHSLGYSDGVPNPVPRRDAAVTLAVCQRCGSGDCQCDLYCCPTKVVEKEEKTYWKVACEQVCIPGFRFPWEKCSSPVCGWVRPVKVLEEDSYECAMCGYEWKVRCVRTAVEPRPHCQCPRCQREIRESQN
jgi:hypothetical protein